MPARPAPMARRDRLRWAAATIALVLAHPAGAKPPEIAAIIPAKEPLGSADAMVLGLPIYRAELWTPGQAAFGWDRPFALSLTYRKGFAADMLVKTSVAEIARIQGQDAAEFAALAPILKGCFADVARDDRITGVSTTADEALFFVNGTQSCTVSFPAFRRLFFGIWLDPRSRDPQAALRLTGQP